MRAHSANSFHSFRLPMISASLANMKFQASLKFAQQMDREDPLRIFRSQFLIPPSSKGRCIYPTGNSLGLQPKTTKKYISEELEDWSALGVEGHMRARRPWLRYHRFTKSALARIVGARPSEVVAMNQLTVNLHLMMVSFYRPTSTRFKIIMEAGAFSSDQYAIETQLKFHGLNPDKALVEISPRPGEYSLRTSDILTTIGEHASELALVLIGVFSTIRVNSLASKKSRPQGTPPAHTLDSTWPTLSAMCRCRCTITA